MKTAAILFSGYIVTVPLLFSRYRGVIAKLLSGNIGTVAVSFLLTLALTSCSQSSYVEVPEAQRRTATYVFGEAAKQYALGNHDAAYSLLHQTLRLNPKHAPSIALLAQYENYLRHPEVADSLLAMALDIEPFNADYLEMNAALAERRGDINKSIDAFERLATVRPRNINVLGQLSKLYIKADMPDSAVSILSRMETMQGRTENISNTKYLLRLAMGDTIGAMNELQGLVDEYPNDPNYAVLLGNAYIRTMERPDTAKAIFDRIAQTDPANARLQLARLNLYERYDTSHYRAYHDSLLYGPDTDPELRGSLILRFISQHQHDSLAKEMTMTMFDSTLIHPQEDSRLLSTYAAYLMAIKVHGDTLANVLNRIIDIDPSNRATLLQLLQHYATQNNSAQVARICDQAITYYPHEAIFYYYSGMGYYLNGDTLVALERITEGCEHIDEQTLSSQAARMYAMQGDILHALGRMDEAFAAYDSCLVYEPDNVMCLNNYAYYLSLQGVALERAEEMSYRTVRAQPDNRTYLDTYAWILFMQGRYNEAAACMDRVMEGIDTSCEEAPESVSPEVFEHAGDIYACHKGDIDRALPYWQAAMRLGCKSKTLKQKIKQRKYIR